MRHGFTATELLVVIAIMVLMVGLAVPSVTESYQRTRVQNAANAIQEAHRQARILARSQNQPAGAAAHFGVRVTDTYAEVLYGPSRWGKAVFPFPAGVVAVTRGGAGDAALSSVDWTYQYGTGYPTNLATYAAPGQLGQAINIGVDGSPVLTDLRVRTVDGTTRGRHSAAIRIFSIGVSHVEME